jgi:hypothetical protein
LDRQNGWKSRYFLHVFIFVLFFVLSFIKIFVHLDAARGAWSRDIFSFDLSGA